MKTSTKRQYTIRNISANIDKAIRKRMKDEGKSLNTVVLEALANSNQIKSHRDLSYLIGSLSEKEAKIISTEIQKQKTIVPDLWL